MMNALYNYIATFLGGALLIHFWNKFINRISVLRYSVVHQHIAISSNVPGIGSIEVLHNKIPVKSLYLSTVTLFNDTHRDLSNIEINLSCDPNSLIIISQASNKSNNKNVFFSESYSKMLSEYNSENPINVLKIRDYSIPVLNRGDIIEFSLIIDNEFCNFPIVGVTCEHLGVKVKFQKEPRQKMFGESSSTSGLIGIFITAIICYLVIYLNVSLTVGVWLSFALGLIAALIGFLFLKLFKILRRIFT